LKLSSPSITVNGTNLLPPSEQFHCGAAFFDMETEPAAPTAESTPFVQDSVGVKVMSQAGLTSVSMSLRDLPIDQVSEQAFESASRLLDVSTFMGADARTINGAMDQNLVWWRGKQGLSVRLLVTLPFNIRVGGAAITVLGADAESAPATPSRAYPPWNRSMRFFRLSQLDDDVVSAYRNAFLALEAALDTAVPPEVELPRGEREWLSAALAQVRELHDLDLENYIETKGSDDSIQQFMDEQYTAVRCCIFHAKYRHRPSILPGEPDALRTVAQALEPLMRLILDINRVALSAPRPGGVLTIAGFNLMLDSLMAAGYQAAVAEVQGDSAVIGATTKLSERANLDGKGAEQRFLGWIALEPSRALGFNSVISFRQEDAVSVESGALNQAFSCSALPRISLDGVDELQLGIRLVLNNRSMPRSRFYF
jgi:hypothetical protein